MYDLPAITFPGLKDLYLLDIELELFFFRVQLFHQLALLAFETTGLTEQRFPVLITLIDLGLQNAEGVQLDGQPNGVVGDKGGEVF